MLTSKGRSLALFSHTNLEFGVLCPLIILFQRHGPESLRKKFLFVKVSKGMFSFKNEIQPFQGKRIRAQNCDKRKVMPFQL
jgi:hypothetical protein